MRWIGNLGDRLPRRLVQLFGGLVLYGVSMALMIESTLGLDPWDVFHQGLTRHTGLSFGTVTILVGAVVLVLWIPLRQRPGVGTVSNVVVIGVAVDAALALLPTVGGLPARLAFLAGGIVLNGVATGLYIGARLGPGPRDGLMTGYVARPPGRSIRLVRTTIELTVLGLGFLLGGTVGIGTIAYALAIGPLAHLFIPLFTVPTPPAARAARRHGIISPWRAGSGTGTMPGSSYRSSSPTVPDATAAPPRPGVPREYASPTCCPPPTT